MSRTSSARKRWQQIVARQRDSGLGVAEFCRRYAVAAASLYAWKRRLRAQAEPTPGFVAVRASGVARAAVQEVEPAPAIELHLDAGRWLVLPRGFDARELRQVLAVLEDRP